MCGRLTYGVFLAVGFIINNSTFCYAVTDPLVNMIDHANGLVKDASSVQEEYANYANTYIQDKIGEFGDFNAVQKKLKKVEKIKERYTKAQEKYNKAKALAEKAKEKKEALTEKANKLKEKADEMKKEYDEAMREINDAKAKIEEAKDKVEEGKKALEEAKETVSTAKDAAKEAIDTAQNKASGAIDSAKEKAGISSEEEITTTDEAGSEKEILVDGASIVEEKQDDEALANKDITFLPEEEGSLTSASDQALTAIQALTTGEDGVVTNISLPSATALPEMMTTISADEVLELSETQDNEVIEAPEATSQFNLEEQLRMSDQLKAKERRERASLQLTVEDLHKELKAGDEVNLKALKESRRQSFETSETAVKERSDEK